MSFAPFVSTSADECSRRAIWRALVVFCARGLAVVTLLLGAMGPIGVIGASEARAGEELVPIRIGWQIPAATQGQIAQVIERTDVLETHGLDPRLVPFSFGTPQVEAALAGKLDAIFAGDQPAVNLIMRGGRWRIVARLFYDRIAIMAPPASPVREVRDLRGKTAASPFGSVGHREMILQQEAAGLDPREDVENEDLDILEIDRLVRAGGPTGWGQIDAVAVWEPNASQLELQRLARTLEASRTIGVVAMAESFIVDHPEAAVHFLVALARAWFYFSQNADRVRQWYIDDAQLGYTPEALRSAARLDPNLGATSLGDIDLRLTEQQVAGLEQAAAWARKWRNASGDFRLDEAVDQSLIVEAMEIIARDELEDIQVVVPSARDPSLADAPSSYALDRFPLWLVFVFIVVVSVAGIEVGQALGKWRRAKGEGEAQGAVGTAVGAVLALLAFVIALTFAAAGSRFDSRKAALLDEVNAIGTAYLRADLLPEPQRTTTRSLIRDYVMIRLGMYRAYRQPDQLRTVQGRTAAIQQTIWSRAETVAQSDPRSEIYGLFVDSVNDMFDLNTTRVVLGAEYRIPLFVWWALWLVAALAMLAVGFQFGIAGRRSITAMLALSLTFALVVLLILDLDRPGEGLIEVNQRPMIELYVSLSRQQ